MKSRTAARAKCLLLAVVITAGVFAACGCSKRDSRIPTGDMEFEVYEESTSYNYDKRTELPKTIRYMDESRKLKKTYTLEEAEEKYAIKLKRSTLICTACDEYSFKHAFICMDYEENIYSCINEVSYRTSDGTRFGLDLKDTEYSSLSAYWNDYKKTTEEYHDVCHNKYSASPEIIEKISGYIFSCLSCSEASPYDHYTYCFAKKIGRRVYTLSMRYYNSPLTESEREEYVELCKNVFKHLQKDNGKEPYIYDKLVNVPFFGGKYMTGFNQLKFVEGNYVNIAFVRVIVDPDEERFSDDHALSGWQDSGEIKIRDDSSYTKEIWFEIDGVTYLCSFSQNLRYSFETPEDMGKYLEYVGALE